MELKFKVLLGILCGWFLCDAVHAQNPAWSARQEILKDTLLFRFAPRVYMFWADYEGNKESIQTMTQVLRDNKAFIESGDIKVRVLGFCASYGSAKENRAAAKNRSNQVKSYFITHAGLKEEHFRTTNYTRRWRGLSDVVAVTCLFKENADSSADDESQKKDEVAVEPAFIQEEPAPMVETPKVDATPQSDSLSSEKTEPVSPVENTDSQTMAPTDPVGKDRPYRWAIKTNIAYWAAAVANIGIEYSFGDHYSIDIPIIYSPYSVARDYQLRFLAVQPEFRYWLRNPMQGHFFGVHLNVGAFNIAVDSKKRYQSPDGFYGVGLSYGYMLPFARHWAAEFTVGAGYVHTKYDSFYNIPNGACYEKDVPYNYWGLTKVGIGLLYRFGK